MDDLKKKASKIRLFLTDADGVLTDGGMVYTEKGDEQKMFNTRDGGGLLLLQTAGIKTGIITSEKTEIVARRAAKLGVDILRQGVKDKLEAFRELEESTGISGEETAYIGDDINDIPLLRAVGLAATVPDHCLPSSVHIHYVTKRQGGKGAVRDFAEWLLKARGQYDKMLERYLQERSGG
jgi:3-deoxy-D-manno-octulosonate 8-phosphate phosphatase (KDO 8-P phosphatase)